MPTIPKKDDNDILGHIIDVSMGDAGDVAVPAEAVPVTMYGVLYKRIKKVRDILELYDAGLAEYKSSMECLFSYSDSAFFLGGNFINYEDATDDMKECLSEDRCLPYKDKPMEFALGGENGNVVFVGAALTLSPADRNANGFEPLNLAVASDGSLTNKDGKKVEDKVESGATKYECECIECGKKATSTSHCKDQTCSSCGGQMRRADRPGPGQKSTGGDTMKKTRILIETDKTAGGTRIEINDKEVKFDTFDFCAYMDSNDDDGIRVYSSYSVIEEKDGGFESPRYFSLASEFVKTDTVEKWTKTFIDALPDSSFAAIEPDYISGASKDKDSRHLPYKDGAGHIDLAHLRSALIMADHIEPKTKSISKKELRSTASRTLEVSAKKSMKDIRLNEMSIDTGSMTMGQMVSHINEIKNLVKGGNDMDLTTLKMPESVASLFKTFDLTGDQVTLAATAIVSAMQEVAGSAVSEKETEMTDKFKDYKDAETVKTEIAEAVKVGIKAAVETDRTEQAEIATKVAARDKDIKDSGIELSEYKKEQMGRFGFDEVGEKEFVAWKEDLKATATKATASTTDTKGKETLKPSVQAVASTGIVSNVEGAF